MTVMCLTKQLNLLLIKQNILLVMLRIYREIWRLFKK